MRGDVCHGCGRRIGADAVSCPGCGRSLGRGDPVPPGWEVTLSAVETLPGTPRWRLAGIDTALPPDGAEDTVPRTSAELFRPASPGEDTVELDPVVSRWRAPARQPRRLTWTPPATASPASERRTASRFVYWVLVGGILATSSAAVLLLAVHMVRSR